MEFQLELTPLQILLNLELYSHIKRFLEIEIAEEEIRKIKNSIQILNVDREKHLTTIHVSYVSKSVKSGLIRRRDDFFVKDGLLESHLKNSYKKIILRAHNSPCFKDFNNFLDLYFKEGTNTLMIDIFSEYFAELIKYMIKMSIREEFSGTKLDILKNKISNDLLKYTKHSSLIAKYLSNQFWTSSRHLCLVNNEYIPVKQKIKNLQKPNYKLVNHIVKKLPEELSGKFLKYLNFTWKLNTLKILDSQIQIRTSFLLKKNIKKFLNNRNIITFECTSINKEILDILKVIISNYHKNRD